MSRIPLIKDHEIEDPEVLELMTQIQQETGDDNALRALAHRPDILKSFAGFYWQLQTEGMIDRKLAELVRLGIAQINQCPSCLAGRYKDAVEQGLSEEIIQLLPFSEDSERFTPREKSAIVFGQKMARDHRTVGDDDFARLYEHFSVEEVVELCMLVAQFIGIGRMFTVIDASNSICEIPL